MDPLSAGATIISFLSLAIQLAGSVQKLHGFWASIGAAADDIQNAVDDLHLLAGILRQIDEEQRLPSIPLQHQLSLNVLRRCERNIDELNNMLSGIHTACAEGSLRNTLATFRFIFKRPQIERFQILLERTKTSLILELLRLNGYSPSSCAVFNLDLLTNQRYRNTHYFSVMTEQIANLAPMRADMIAVNQQLETEHVTYSSQPDDSYSPESVNTEECARVETEHALPPMRMVRRNSLGRLSCRRKFSKHFNTLFGTVVLVSQVNSFQGIETPKHAHDRKGQDCHKWVVKIVPVGTLKCIFKSAVDFSISWKTSRATPCGFTTIQQCLRYYPVVPETAEIFEACKIGNISWVMSLLSRNVASPFDTDPNGWTPLHVSAYANHTELCRKLIDLGAETNALTSFESHPLALACMGDRFDHEPLLELVRVLIEYGGSDPTIQDSIGDDCLYHIRRSTTIPRYLRLQSSVPCGFNDSGNGPVSALHWAVVECACPEKIKTLLQQGVNPNEWNYGFRSETGPILHSSASLLTPAQTTSDGLSPAARDCRIKEIINLVLAGGSHLHAVDDNLVTALDIVLEICRKWRYRKGLSIWRAAIEEAGNDWEVYLAKEKSMHSERSRVDYGGARDYYWSLEMQKDYWLSHDWEEEAQERLFWNPERLDFDPLKDSGGTYAPSLRSCRAKGRSKGTRQYRH